MAKQLFQIVLSGTKVLGKTLARSLREEIQASQEAARLLRQTNPTKYLTGSKMGISLDEAKRILAVDSLTLNEIKNRYEFLFAANEPKNGGTHYIQSKIVRARERLEHELQDENK